MRPATDLLETWNSCGYYGLVGMRVTHADPDSAQLELEVTDAHLQAYGTAHGGIVAGLLDAAMGLAILARLGEGQGCATVEMKLNFVAPAMPGELIGVGRVLHQGRRLVVASAEVRDADGGMVACGQGTFQAFPTEARA